MSCHIYRNTIDFTSYLAHSRSVNDAPKAIAYLRVSTDRQAEVGLGLDVQHEAIQSWTQQNGYVLVETFRDEGVSGSKELDHRPALLEAFQALREGRAVALVVYRLDRLARDLILQEQLLGEVKRFGARVCSTSAAEAGYLTDDPDDPSRKLIRQILGAFAEYERSLIALRLSSGRRYKAQHDGYAYGGPPYGFKAVNGTLVPSVVEQTAVNRIVDLRDGGATLREIASKLTDEGYMPKRSPVWHPELKRILARHKATQSA